MAQVKVYNDNVFTHKEYFKGDLIEIKPKGFVKMDEETAYEFKGQYFPIMKNADGQQIPESYKIIRIVKDAGEDSSVLAGHKCNLCGHAASTEKELDTHTKSEHSSAPLVTNDDLDKAIARSRKG